MFEIEAAYYLGSKYESAFIKTVKFRVSPTTTELINQIKLVLGQFEIICFTPKNLTVRLLKQTREEQQQEQVAAKNEECDQATAMSTAIMQKLLA